MDKDEFGAEFSVNKKSKCADCLIYLLPKKNPSKIDYFPYDLKVYVPGFNMFSSPASTEIFFSTTLGYGAWMRLFFFYLEISGSNFGYEKIFDRKYFSPNETLRDEIRV